MVALEAIAWVAIILIVGAYLLLGTYIAKKFPNLRFFLGVILTFLIPALIACKTMFESNMAQAIVFFFLLIVFYYINKSIAESADEELKKEPDQKQARASYKSK